ncbi:MAG TPA: hypothetical protein VIB38_14560 [Aestuariivirgaceae bacterium]|jgi:hypothetical protein
MIRLIILSIAGALILLGAAETCRGQAAAPPPLPEAQESAVTNEPDTVPPVKTIDLTPDVAKKAIDGFVLARERYTNTMLDQYETLEEFIARSAEGKALQAELKTLGFANVADWEVAIATVSLTYGAISDGADYDVPQQIEEIKTDSSLTAAKKDELIAWLTSLIPSETNKKVIAEIMKDESYRQKLDLLTEEE